MQSIKDLNLYEGDFITYSSPVCSVACSLADKDDYVGIGHRQNELVMSYYYQWRMVVDTYNRLYEILQELNSYPDEDYQSIITAYDVKVIDVQEEIKHYTHLFIVSLKTFLDLFTCLVDIIVSNEVKEEHRLPDFSKFSKIKGLPAELLILVDSLNEPGHYPWIKNVSTVRNKIIHRGYQIEPEIGFTKSDQLLVKAFQGVDRYLNIHILNIGDVFRLFILDMPKIEQAVADILLSHAPVLDKKLSVVSGFKYSGSYCEFSYSEVNPI